MGHIVRIHRKGGVLEKTVKAGANLLRFLQNQSIEIVSLCGGNGTCGKCRVRANGLSAPISDEEKNILGSKAVSKGYRLSCRSEINSDIDVYIDDISRKAKILTEGKIVSIKLEPIIRKRVDSFKSPGTNDKKPDVERVLSVLGVDGSCIPLSLMRKLPEILKNGGFTATSVYMGEKLIAIEPGDTTKKIFGIAMDVGTTTIAAYLYDLCTGKRVDVYSVLNPQNKFGADVISRIEYTKGSQDLLSEMSREIVTCINRIIDYFADNNNIKKMDIYVAMFVGNTTMMHFLLKLPADNIAVSPFIPVTTSLQQHIAEELGIDINRYGYITVLPCVSAYVGADTVAAVLSGGIYKSEKISLLIDIGTNGEIVLGNNQWLFACSTAAGPAFEGANIRNGAGGVNGAIDKVRFAPIFGYDTIGNGTAIGICGSGIVDIIAGMVSTGIIDETGRIISKAEADTGFAGLTDKTGELKNRLISIDGMNSFLISESEDCATGADIIVTQRDVRELQNAKAAMAAGINILIKQAGITVEQVNRVYLAGGFGSCINVDNALKIGLLPSELKGKIKSIGNAAGTGAIECLLSAEMLKKAEKIKKKLKYIELSICPDFSDEYIKCMMFPVKGNYENISFQGR